MSLFKRFIVTTLLWSTTAMAQSSLALNINDTDIEVQSIIDLNNFMQYSSETNYLLDIDYLHSDGDNMSALGFRAKNLFPGVEGLSLSFGLKGVFVSDFAALPFTLKSEYILPLVEVIPTTTFNLSFAYAPEILTFRDAKHYFESRMGLDMEVITDIHLFAGYRYIDTKYQDKDTTFNSSLYAGMKISF